jgi:hypothetical protein
MVLSNSQGSAPEANWGAPGAATRLAVLSALSHGDEATGRRHRGVSIQIREP